MSNSFSDVTVANSSNESGEHFRASERGGGYPRPQLMRPDWTDLSGSWNFAFDDNDEGLAAAWRLRRDWPLTISVPFPPESPASGIRDTDFHSVVWYQRSIESAYFDRAPGSHVILHFNAVDYRCMVWLNGTFLGEHEGGHTPFWFDVTNALVDGAQSLALRVEDDPLDVAQPRGKQDWQLAPHAVWYHRTTGIWQQVWLETVPEVSIESLRWTPRISEGRVQAEIQLSRSATPGTELAIALSFGEAAIAELRIPIVGDHASATLELRAQANGQAYEELLWSPEMPRLLDAIVTLRPDSENDQSIDTVYSYLGLRSVAVDRGAFVLNDRPYYVRSILSQGYWAESHLASPSTEALRAEAELIKDLGFNATRVHQKIEDPRFLYWTDRLGLLVWSEMPSAFEFSAIAVKRTSAEWMEVIERDASHPSIVTWVPLNESWGVQHIAHSEEMQSHARALFHLTKALDPTRPVISNDGWEHLESDVWSIHDYEWSADVVRARYADDEARQRLFTGFGPAGRRIRLSDEPDRGQPVMLTEFGGIRFAAHNADGTEWSDTETWGYSTASSASDFAERLSSLFDAVRTSSFLAGFCYTQLTDTMQEANGLVTENREPKLPIEQLRAIITGSGPRGHRTSSESELMKTNIAREGGAPTRR